jgi:Domain of unknown function (DUF4383)
MTVPRLAPQVIRWSVAAFAVLFAIVVVMGWVPGWYTMEGQERKLFGLFMLSPLDDITHGLTAVAALLAALAGGAWPRRFLVVFGSYYGLDALFFLSYGAVNDKPWIADVLLNTPHVGIAAAMAALVYANDQAALSPITSPMLPRSGRAALESAPAPGDGLTGGH